MRSQEIIAKARSLFSSPNKTNRVFPFAQRAVGNRLYLLTDILCKNPVSELQAIAPQPFPKVVIASLTKIQPP
ncbi:hypothetical protein [Coleofasciculus sp. H7-2]|uniref:hypothetical protein n=1 Tax=Coleofasciculus sp. H7-2 TaxID=3351545 RepID=UPI0036715E5F